MYINTYRISAEYIALLEAGPRPIAPAKDAILRLLRSAEADSSTERCWNWKAPRLEVRRTLRNRGPVYNGHPVSPGYFGAFSMDGLALALHCFYSTGSFNDAVVKVVNFCGDSDTTGSICAQMAGYVWCVCMSCLVKYHIPVPYGTYGSPLDWSFVTIWRDQLGSEFSLEWHSDKQCMLVFLCVFLFYLSHCVLLRNAEGFFIRCNTDMAKA
jgi:hypothetical protein